MSTFVVCVVLFAALLHASWNALVKSRPDTHSITVLVSAGAALVSLAALPFVQQPAPESWPFIAASSLVEVIYFQMLVATYRDGDISHAYPLMRGTAPLLVALANAPLTGERLAPMQWLAIGCICGGILTMFFTAGFHHRAARRTTTFALLTACLIATYTMIDGIGVRKSGGAPAAYTMWIFVFTAVGFIAWSARTRPRQLWHFALANPGVMVFGGIANLSSYALAVWAMTMAPVATVAALRETSILFATAIAALVLKEKVSPQRLAAIGLVACGAVVMRLT